MSGDVTHGTRHAPRGSDPAVTDVWRELVIPGTTWDGGTTYGAGDIVDDTDGFLQYQATAGSVVISGTPTSNVGIEPGVTATWQQFWNVYASIWQNGGPATPTTAVPNPVPFRYRLSVGPPNYYDDGVLVYTHHQIDIQGDADGLVIGDTVFVMPPEYRHDYDVPYHTHDKYGAYVPCRLLASGEFIWGQV